MTKKKWFIKPLYWSIIILIIAQALTIVSVWHQQPFLDDHQIYVPTQPDTDIVIWPTPVTDPDTGEIIEPAPDPTSSIGVIVIYFAVVIAIIAIVFAVIPLKALSVVFKCLFTILFAWGVIVLLGIWINIWVAIGLAVVLAVCWFIRPKIWLHNTLMITSMVSIASIFGRFISPWTAMILLILMAIYDYISVKKGLMLWMVDKMSNVNSLPAFVLPATPDELKDNLNTPNIKVIAEQKPEDKDYSILGGGDIAFPLILSAACYFRHELIASIIIGLSSVVGLVLVYFIQEKFLHGKPMPALPPLAATTFIAFLFVSYVL